MNKPSFHSFMINIMTPILETPRLILRPLELADAEQAQAIFPQWEIVRYLTKSVPWPYPPDGATTFYRDVALPAVARGEEWYWMIRPKSSPNQLIGAITLMCSKLKTVASGLTRAGRGRG